MAYTLLVQTKFHIIYVIFNGTPLYVVQGRCNSVMSIDAYE
jgi:hypothetical protein